MNGQKLSHEFANKVYNVLVEHAGASEAMRDNFIYAHCIDEYPCWEYRFQGLFGFGGKYRSLNNRIDYYSEDHTKKLDKLEAKVNLLLSNLI